MENILNIKYQNRDIRFNKEAYDAFLQYEETLKSYFSKEESGDEIMHDLKNRMAEIFEDKLKAGAEAITLQDIDDLKVNIGSPSEFDQADDANAKDQYKNNEHQDQFSKKRLLRNKNKGERIIAGVCSGLANYFSIDPVVVRIIFVLVAIFNMATFFNFNMAIAVYLILWVAVPQEYLKSNVQQKLFRNPKDKVIGGICSGLAQFFNTESWIIRTIFLLPVLIHVFSDHVPMHFSFMGTSLAGMLVMIYITLWIILPLAKTSTDYMLLKGEPINISTIQNPVSMKAVSHDARRGFNSVAKIIAYIFIALAILVLIPTTFGFLVAGLFMVNIAKAVLFTPVLKTLGIIAFILLLSLPLLSIIIWIIRRIAGYKKRSRPLRYVFLTLWITALVFGGYVSVSLFNDMKSVVSKTEMHRMPYTGADTLYLRPMDTVSNTTQHVLFDMNEWNNVLRVRGDHFDVQGIHLNYESSPDSQVLVKIEKFAFGKNAETAEQNNNVYTYEPEMRDNMIFLPTQLSIPSNTPYRCQNIKVTIYVPDHKTLIVTKELRRKLKYRFGARKNGLSINSNGGTKDKIIRFGDQHTHITITNDDEDEDWSSDDRKEWKKVMKENIREMKEELKNNHREAEEELDETKKDAQSQIEEARRDLERSKKEAQQQIEKAERNLKKAEEETQRKLDEAQRKLDEQ